jgi:hypothetical protein
MPESGGDHDRDAGKPRAAAVVHSTGKIPEPLLEATEYLAPSALSRRAEGPGS